MNDLFFGGKWHFSHAMPILEPIYPSKSKLLGATLMGHMWERPRPVVVHRVSFLFLW